VSAPIQFRLAGHNSSDAEQRLLPADFAQRDLQRAIQDEGSPATAQSSALSKVIQLTGFSDPIYSETYVQVNQSDLLLDVLLVNQTAETLQNVSFDLATSGDLRVVEKPSPLNLTPHGFAAVKLCLKVASTGNGLVYGAISYGTVEPRSVVLAPLPVDIVEYIRPASIDEADFRHTWTLLEWENKINITPVTVPNGSSSDLVLRLFLERLLAATHLACITPAFGLAEGGEYLAANMYAKSVFGEDVLANICLERTQASEETSAVVTGHVRLRSKTQGIAIALGDKISAFVARK
jgi:coatomer subunit beta